MQNVTATAMPLPQSVMSTGPAAMPTLVTPQAAMAQVPQLAIPQTAVPQMALPLAGQGMVMPQPAAFPQAMPVGAGIPAGFVPVGTVPQGALPMAQAGIPPQAMLGAEAVKPPSTIGSVIRNALVFGGAGAAAGALYGLLPLPGGPLIGAAIGGLVGAAIGVFRGIRSARKAQEEFQMMMQGTSPHPADPNSLGPEVPIKRVDTSRPAKSKRTTGKKRTVTVQRGDTLGKIAKQHGVTVKALHLANKDVIGADPGKISVGAKLVLPKKAAKRA